MKTVKRKTGIMGDRPKSKPLAEIKYDKVCKYVQKPSKYEYDDPTKKSFWKKSIDELEEQSREVRGSSLESAWLYAFVFLIFFPF